MSRLNGDKSRHQINRKRVVVRRAKIRELIEAAKTAKPAGAETSAKAKTPVRDKTSAKEKPSADKPSAT
jgi:hypothetical protein